MNKNNKTNGIRVEKRDIDWLLNRYSVKDIETSVEENEARLDKLHGDFDSLEQRVKESHEKAVMAAKQF